jgi:hypothetical protein
VSLKQSAHTRNLAKTQDSDLTFFDPSLIKAARNIYRDYYSLGLRVDEEAVGVVINRDSHRGQLAFRSKPILLPRECFISLKQIESDGY